ncbi:MAG: tRNA dihydrouridine synthase DusB [Deltaproteobacteria bacterium]|nr:tRNA dihydrouridine synthase DusB [Deltaproteobacteria bacterium]MBW1871790.1 tRNA dihydrouridine synthase DusB [Deltaproteobacteria bacterium]
MNIGRLTIDPPVLLAPLAGISDSPFRAVTRGLGCPGVVTEMVSAEGILRQGRGSLELLDYSPAEHPLIVQIFGQQPERMATAASLCAEKGFDGIDINMGCPVKKVVRNGAGAALMRNHDKAVEIVKAVRRAVDLPISVKMRSGWARAEICAIELSKKLVDAGADLIVIHPRTRNQFFTGQADWNLIALLVEALAVPVIGNGDLQNVEDGLRMQTQTGCAGVMVGRAALGNPWLPAAIGRHMQSATSPGYPPDDNQRRDIFCIHLQKMIDWLGCEQRAVLRMRKHLVWYTRGFEGATSLRRKLYRMNTAAEMKTALDELLFKTGRQPDATERS